jgi:cytochrome c biogenesis protein CcdA
MSATEDLKDADGKPLDPATQAVVNKVRRMSLISGIATVLGISVVITMIGYRIYKSSESVPAQVEVVAMLPKGAKVIATGVSGDRVVVTVEVGGVTEIRTFDAKSLQPAGRLRFANEP